MLNAHHGALYFWYFVGIIVIVVMFFYDLNGWSEHFTLNSARPYQSDSWDQDSSSNNDEDIYDHKKRTFRRRKRKLIYITILTLWCFTPYTFHILSDAESL
mmetsp:Transcript_44025/g.56420  ORF Transcript_44025/g.56420 Transcript_44025/m.56420 type:complete len:101 (+) Transcript_44025:24-326(+)